MITRKCEYCEKEFLTYTSRIKIGHGRYCSKECVSLSQRKRIGLNCNACGKEHEIIFSKKSLYKNNYCSQKCYQGTEKVPRRKLDEDEVIEVYAKNKFIRKTAKYFGCSRAPIKRILKKRGITRLWNSNEIIDIDKKEVCLMYEKKLSLKEIAKKMGCDYTVVSKILKKNGIIIRRSSYHLEENARSRIGKTLTEIHGYEKAMLLKKSVSAGVKRWLKDHPDQVKKMVEKLRENPKWFNTKPERIMKDALIERGWKLNEDFIFQYRESIIKEFPHHIIDFVFPKCKLVIYVDGDYWHGNPLLYKENPTEEDLKNGVKKLNLFQLDKKKTDEKIEYALRKNGWRIKRFWEKEIIMNIEKCMKIIDKELIVLL